MEECAALYTDLQAFAMGDAYLDEGMLDEAVFSLFVQQLPPGLNFLAACGLEEALRSLETLCFPREALDDLASLQCFSDRLLSYCEYARRELEHLPPELRDLTHSQPAYRVEVSPVLAWTREQLIDAWAASP